ncbi:hypothetical protein KKG05_04155 [bacterium]|nr:hypothetical protein [bacterium]
MEWKKLPLILLMAFGLLFLTFGCDSSDDEEPPPPTGNLELGATSLDFGTGITEQQITLSNTGNASLSWSINDASVPYWVVVTPDNGDLAAGVQTTITIRVERSGVSPGTSTATVLFESDADDEELVLSVERTCNILSDDFNEGGAAAWNATAMDKSQNEDEGYVVLDPNSAIEAGRLLQTISPTAPYTVSARVRRTVQTAEYKEYGILLEGASIYDALYFTVVVENSTANYMLQQVQPVDSIWVVLSAGLTTLLSTDGGVWNLLRLEIYDDGGTTKARGYAGTEDTPLFTGVELNAGLNVTKLGLRSEEYTIHADWFCAQ